MISLRPVFAVVWNTHDLDTDAALFEVCVEWLVERATHRSHKPRVVQFSTNQIMHGGGRSRDFPCFTWQAMRQIPVLPLPVCVSCELCEARSWSVPSVSRAINAKYGVNQSQNSYDSK
jgi:hypothetical protein